MMFKNLTMSTPECTPLAAFEIKLLSTLPCLILVREARIVRRRFDIRGRLDHVRHDAAKKQLCSDR